MRGLTLVLVLGIVLFVEARRTGARTCPNVTEDPPEDILLPHEWDCSKFYKCSHGQKVTQICPAGLYFNPDSNPPQCDWPFNVNCQHENSDSNEDDTDNGCPEPGQDPEDDVLLPHECDCTKFYKCSHGEKIPMDCPDGLHFNPATKQCDWPFNVNCTSNCTLTPVTHPRNFRRHETDCTKFYLIFNGKPFEYTCPAGLHFNIDLEACDYESNVRCPNLPANDDETSKNANNNKSN